MKNIESALKETTSTAIYAIPSGILTDLIIGLFADSTYIGKYDDGKIELISQGNFTPVQTILFALGIFIILWIVLVKTVPKLTSVFLRLSYRPFKRYSRTEVVETYNRVRNSVMKTADILSNKTFAVEAQNTFYFVELVKDVKQLTDVFIVPDNKYGLLKRSYFRAGKTIDDVLKYISAYELSAMIEVLYNLLEKTHNASPKGPVQNKDLLDAKERLNELEINLGLKDH